MVLGFFLASASTSLTSPSGFQDLLFGFGVLLWIIGVLGTVYAVVNRLAGQRAAKLAVVVLVLTLIIKIISGEHYNQNPRSRTNPPQTASAGSPGSGSRFQSVN